ncbi:MAG: Rieske (2Fe-2S) protein [Sphingobacterium composti]|uniref:Rieske (2Fe-2S) protein n=1 Tax=Sphingobacterium composti TaxID=363260 RepID=UPI001359FD01|nr:Rieske (2Fe-2S) protein [Sphingobacterium composti Ten et al. 2007 non Yoo et al. 2007]
MKWHKIPSNAINSKQPIQLLKGDGQKYCLIYHQEKWYATSAKCPHAGANLAGGKCEDGKLICPFHRHSFDLISGKGAEGQNNYITTYRIEKRNNDQYVQLPQNLFKKYLGF